MSGENPDPKGGFPGWNMSEPVDHFCGVAGVLHREIVKNLRDHLLRHGLVDFVEERNNVFRSFVIADHAVKGHHRPRGWIGVVGRDLNYIRGKMNQDLHSAAGHGGENGYLVWGIQRLVRLQEAAIFSKTTGGQEGLKRWIFVRQELLKSLRL